MAKVTIPKGELNKFDLPPVCVITGEHTHVDFHPVKFSWYPRWIVVLVIVNLLIAAIVAMILTRQVRGELPFSDEGWRRYRRAKLMSTLSILFLFAGLIGGGFVFGLYNENLGVALWILSIVGPLAVIFTLVRGSSIGCVNIKDGQIVLNVPSVSASFEIREHLHGGAAIPLATSPVQPA